MEDAVVHRQAGDEADQRQGLVFGEESPKRGQFFVQEMIDIGAAQAALDAGQTNRFRGDGDGVVFLLPAIGPLALAPHGQIDDLLAEDLLHDARQAGSHQILHQCAEFVGQFAPAPVHFAVLLSAFLLEGGGVGLGGFAVNAHFFLESLGVFLKRPQLRFGTHLGVVQFVEFDADAGNEFAQHLVQMIHSFGDDHLKPGPHSM